MMPRPNDNAQSSPRPSAVHRMMLADMEAGIDIGAPATVNVGEPRAPRDRTVKAAEWGWTPEQDRP